jgi:predicted acylesterase/phospholipase RssA
MNAENKRATDPIVAPANEPTRFEQVLRDEISAITEMRKQLEVTSQPETSKADNTASTLTGLAFSGGGIRSATFNLGVIQALAEFRLLSKFDYLSTVSGGGYIGSWLSALIYRAFNDPERANVSEETRKQLKKAAGEKDSVAAEKQKWHALQEELAVLNLDQSTPAESPAISHLRSYSNYLTPRRGLFKADTLTSVATYLRNTFLNLLILICMVAAILLLPQLVVKIGMATNATSDWFRVMGIGQPVIFVLGMIVANLSYIPRPNQSTYPWHMRQLTIVGLIALPTIFIALNASVYLYSIGQDPDIIKMRWEKWVLLGATFYFLLWLTGYCLAVAINALSKIPGAQNSQVIDSKIRFFGGNFLAIVIAGGVGGLLFYWLFGFLPRSGEKEIDMWFVAGFVAPMALLLFNIIVTIHLGLVGRSFTEMTREWWSRLGGWTLLALSAWALLFATVIYAPALVEHLQAWWHVGGLSWAISSISGILFARGAKTGNDIKFGWRELVALVAPFVFVLGLCLIIAFGLQMAIMKMENLQSCAGNSDLNTLVLCHLSQLQEIKAGYVHWIGAIALLVGIAVMLSWRVDINLFSIYQYYKNRLARAYLGASRARRYTNPFTGFDMDDDLPMAKLQKQRPYHIINTALNLVSGKDLAWQQRKAAAFSPKYSGFELPLTGSSEDPQGGYRPSHEYLDEGGISIGQALAISGAAASPNMGYHSSPALAFLMTVFNVRLGRWCGNPANTVRGPSALSSKLVQAFGLVPEIWRRDGPQFGAWYLLREMFSSTKEDTPFVYLSDGGHFENLAIYELVRRHCKFIVVCDAGADGEGNFNDLGNAIRKCYVDLGVEIAIDVDALRRADGTNRSQHHCAIGTIHYERLEKGAAPGTLVYIKPTMGGNEPSDILNYAAQHKDFPHESTADQWFDEAQFESYRKLGYHIANEVFASALTIGFANRDEFHEQPDPNLSTEELSLALRQLYAKTADANTIEQSIQ